MKKSVKITLIVSSVLIAIIALLVGFFFLIIDPGVNILNAEELDLDKLTSYSRTVTLLDMYGNPIDEALYDNNKIYVCIDDLPDHTVNAFIAIEDKRFFKHNGIDYYRIASAILSNIKSGGFNQGASTITQQLIKNTHLSNEKNIRRKLSEMRLARKLERIYNKRQILESYFNILYFGSGIRGLGTASRVMFDKSASELTVAQSAALASIINNPTKYSPYNNPDNLNKRKNLVLDQMLDQGYIDRSAYNSAISEEIIFNKNTQSQFVSGVLKSACDRLNCSEKTLFNYNYTLTTSYDPNISHAAREALRDLNANYSARILVLGNRSGGVVCDETNTGEYINPKRSPASTIKPFLSYAAALESGLNPLSQIADEPTVFGDYSPHNYRNVYRGYQSLKECLIYSSNIAAVKLLRYIGVEKSKTVARSFGLPFEKSDDTLAIALGGMEKGVTLIELANAYRTLANGGQYSDTHYVESVKRNDAMLYSVNKRQSSRAVGEDTAYLLTDMLMECAKTGTAKRLKNLGVIAAKTGTNGDENGNYDCYCIAYTPDHTIAVWYGSNENIIPNNITGASCCAIIDKVCTNGKIETNKRFDMPNTVAYFEIDGQELRENHSVYLADPLLPKRYRQSVLLSKRFLPIRKNIDILDYYDKFMWEMPGRC